MQQAQSSIDSANGFYRDVYKIIKTRLEHLKQSLRKLPAGVIDKLNDEIKLNLNNPDKVMNEIGSLLNDAQTVASLTELVASSLTSTGLAAADGLVADLAEIAGEACAVLAVVVFGLALYNGITEIEKLNDAIDKVKKKREDAEKAIKQMKKSLDGLLKALGLTVGGYETLRDMSNDWSQLANSFDKYSTAFYYGPPTLLTVAQ